MIIFFNPYPKTKKCAKKSCSRDAIDGDHCPRHTLQILSKKDKFKKPKPFIPKDEAQKLFDKCHIIWSNIIRGNELMSKCSTCEKPLITKGGLFQAHAGHYYDKGYYWKLAFELNNGGTQCPYCNTNTDNPAIKERMKIKLRQHLASVHGPESINKLDEMAIEFEDRMKRGIENKKPRQHDPLHELHGRPSDLDWLQEKLFFLKNVIKQ